MTITPAILNNLRIVEDTAWLLAFGVMILAALRYAHAAFGSLRRGYLLLAGAGAAGIAWKGIGLVSRVLELKRPEWLFSLAREALEGATGALFTAACLTLVLALGALYSDAERR